MKKRYVINNQHQWEDYPAGGFGGTAPEDQGELQSGGYLIPNVMEFDLPGFKASFWRWMGRRFGRETWRLRGVETRNWLAELNRNIAEAKIEKPDYDIDDEEKDGAT